ncbi:uncharacterized protein LOC127081821 [Lathyrus oleraceus]|uniref:uncharacterized protein LOC127081821 n=1 Tax=Pisum sativum TaxID=3888 RepID=UPI0021D0E3CA|nr:uncharacterized protein LOC127081821 [Pisum sativum]
MSYMQIEELIKDEGYCNIKCLWYWNLNFSFSRGFQPLNNDNDVLRFMEDVRGFKVIDIYVEHKVEEINIEDVMFEEDNYEEVNVEGADEEVNIDGADGEVNVEGVDEESETYPYYNMSSEDDKEYDIDELNLGTDVSVNWTTVLPNATIEQPSKLDDISNNDSCDSYVLHTPGDSDVEVDMERFPTFKETIKLEVGMMFKDKLQIKDVIKEYAIENKKIFVFKKNDKKRMVVKYIEGCPFYIRFNMWTTNQFWKLLA